MNTDKFSTVQELFDNDSSVSMHMRNIQTLATVIYKVVNDISQELVKEKAFMKKWAMTLGITIMLEIHY